MSSVIIAGDTSGSITIAAPAAAGTNTITMPASTGTMALTSDVPDNVLNTYATFVNSTELVTTISNWTATGTINYDTNTQSVVYYTSVANAGDWTINFRASSGATLNSVLASG